MKEYALRFNDGSKHWFRITSLGEIEDANIPIAATYSANCIIDLDSGSIIKSIKQTHIDKEKLNELKSVPFLSNVLCQLYDIDSMDPCMHDKIRRALNNFIRFECREDINKEISRHSNL